MTPFSPRMALMIFLGLLPQQTCLVLPSAARPAARKSTALNVMLRQRDTQHIWAGVDTMNKFERLAAEEELELGRQVQAALLLDQLRYDDDGKPLSADKWAAAAGVSVEELVAALERAQAARRVLILSNLRLAASVARKFVGRGLTFEELVQEGVMGMDRAVTLFDPSRKVRFSTYAIQWIEQRIRMALKRYGMLIRLPSRLQDNRNKIIAITKRISLERESPPTDEEIMKLAKINQRDLDNVRALRVSVSSMEDTTGAIVEDFQSDEDSDPNVYVEGNALRADVEKTLLRALTPAERDIVRLRVGLDDGNSRTFNEVARLLGLRYQDVVKYERSALKKLRGEDHLARLDGYMGVDKEETQRLALSGSLSQTLSSRLPTRGRPKRSN